jgi:hypothetical protein
VRMRDGRLVGDRAVDLSPQGMLVLSDERVEPGESLLVSFRATECSIWFDTDATLTRVVEGRRPGDRGRALGLHFGSLSALMRLILRGPLNRAPPVPPARDPPYELRRPTFDYCDAMRRALAATTD